MLKVLHILNELKPSGAETMLLSAANVWMPSSEQHILTTGKQEGPFANALRAVGYRIHHRPFAKSPVYFRNLGRFIDDGNYDVLHLHTERASLWYAIAARCCCRRDLRLIRTVHHLFQFEGLFRIRRMFERQIMKRFLGVLFLSNSPSGQRNESHRFHMNNELAPNWYDSCKFRPPTPQERKQARARCGFDKKVTVFVSLGGNWAYKNYDLIVRALARIPEDYPALYVQIGVQGEGRPLETLADSLQVSRSLQCVGILEDPLPYLHAADAYLMPSSEEGFGVAAVEAMACGLPAILSDVPALCDFKERVEGIRYIRPEVEDITEAMIECVKTPDAERRQIGKLQARNVEACYGLGVGPLTYLEAWRR
jgi:glycosyltransferase involved in cell wall biosynthesis